MALEYTLELATELSPEEVLRILSGLGFEFDTQAGLRAVSPGVTVSAASEDDLGRSIIKEAYRFDPTMYLKFRLDKFEARETGLQTTIKVTLALLRKIGADGILLFNGETPVLMSMNGAMTLNNAHDFWDQPDLLTLVTEPYQMHRIASL